MSFGLWIAVLATANLFLYALWFRWFDRQPITDSDHYFAKVDREIDEALDEQLWRERSLHANRVWDAALDEERRAMEADFDAAEQEYLEGEFVRAIEAWLEQREMTS